LNDSYPQALTIEYSVADYWGDETAAGSFSIPAGEPGASLTLTDASLPTGHYRINYALVDGEVETPGYTTFSVVKPLDERYIPTDDSPFAIDYGGSGRYVTVANGQQEHDASVALLNDFARSLNLAGERGHEL